MNGLAYGHGAMICYDIIEGRPRHYHRPHEQTTPISWRAGSRLIVSVPMEAVEAIDRLIAYPYGRDHPAHGNRSEFVRLAIREKLNREKRRRTYPLSG
ncbi:hypothetical protein BH18PSE1_BH18PSE1_08580 [soil metagenome]